MTTKSQFNFKADVIQTTSGHQRANTSFNKDMLEKIFKNQQAIVKEPSAHAQPKIIVNLYKNPLKNLKGAIVKGFPKFSW